MSNEKQQINEMALAICKSRGVAEVDDCGKCGRYADCLYYEIADSLYKADYRRQREGEWVWEHDALNDPKRYFIRAVCTCCGLKTGQVSNYCPNCGASMKGGAE